jgi:hypothetical protein
MTSMDKGFGRGVGVLVGIEVGVLVGCGVGVDAGRVAVGVALGAVFTLGTTPDWLLGASTATPGAGPVQAARHRAKRSTRLRLAAIRFMNPP